MKQISLDKLNVIITADNTAFIVKIGNECFAETYMDGQTCRWPNPADGKMWGYIKGPATNVRIPVPYPGKHELGLLIGGRLFKQEHDFPDLYAEPEQPAESDPEQPEQPAEEPAEGPEQPVEHEPEQPAEERKNTVSIDVNNIKAMLQDLRNMVVFMEAALNQEDE